MSALLELSPDEYKLIEVVRDIKRSGFGEFQGTIAAREITTIREMYAHKLTK